ncbi:hypothetical protein [Marinilactibacillus psychrotolerans]|uniref:hypothetical protein n=1 Tax=Marinilactibacillus psychrotolerans TaxID=191770 RepID=UPI003883CE1D
MLAFIAWTPLHVINILNTKFSYYPNESADLYIYNEFNNANKIYENIKKEEIFNNVYLVEYTKMGNSIESKINILINKNIMIPEAEPFKYDIIFTQGGNYFLKILFGKAKKINPKLKLNYIEDGLATYSSFDFRNIAKHRELVMNILNPYSIFKEDYSEYFVYKPEQVDLIEKNKIRKLPQISKEGNLILRLKNIFGLQKEKIEMKNTIIFFDQPHINKELEKLEKLAFNQIINHKNKFNVLVKLHPRSPKGKYADDIKILDTKLPWELCCLIYNLNNLVTVSLYSTASVSSSLMFNVKTNNILLTKMLVDDPLYYDLISSDEETVKKLKDLYNIVSKFESLPNSNLVIPNSENELLDELKFINNNFIQ